MPSELVKLAEKTFTEKEKKLVVELMKSDSMIELVLPKEMDPKDWLFTASVACRLLLKAQLQEQQLLPVLGRLLVVAKENPAIYTENGYTGFDEFVTTEIHAKWGVSRSTCYEAVRAAEFSSRALLTPADLKEIGRVKMRTLVKLIEEGKEGNKVNQNLIQKAKELPIKEFEELVEKQYHVEHGSGTGAFIKIPTNKATAKRWEKFVNDPDIQASAKTGKADKILVAMMDECSGAWLGAEEQPAPVEQEEEAPEEVVAEA